MKYLLFWVGLVFCLALAMPAHAHHGGSSSSRKAGSSISSRIQGPRSYVLFNFNFDFLDEDLGNIFLFQVQGEYAVHSRFSLGARVPVWRIRQDFLPNSNRVGDLALLLKGVAAYWQQQSLQLLVGLDTSFPTGDDEISAGAGVVVFNPYLTLTKDFGKVNVFASAGISLEAGSPPNPTMNYGLGVTIDLINGKVPLQLLLALQGNTFFDSDTFESGSTKALATAGFVIQMNRHWEATLLGQVSVLDTLDFKSGVTFSDFATGLLSDVNAGFSLNFAYQF